MFADIMMTFYTFIQSKHLPRNRVKNVYISQKFYDLIRKEAKQSGSMIATPNKTPYSQQNQIKPYIIIHGVNVVPHPECKFFEVYTNNQDLFSDPFDFLEGKTAHEKMKWMSML